MTNTMLSLDEISDGLQLRFSATVRAVQNGEMEIAKSSHDEMADFLAMNAMNIGLSLLHLKSLLEDQKQSNNWRDLPCTLGDLHDFISNRKLNTAPDGGK